MGERKVSDVAVQGEGHAPVRRLRDLLMDRLPPDELDELLLRAPSAGRPPRQRLLEVCVRAEDPRDLLRDPFTARRLRQLAFEFGIDVQRKSAAQICDEILGRLGFAAARSVRGLTTAQRDLERGHREAQIARSIPEVRGLVAEGSSSLEYVLLVLLRFVLGTEVSVSWADWLREHAGLGAKEQVARCSLGRLLGFVETVASHVHKGRFAGGQFEGLRKLTESSDARRLIPAESTQIAGLRNRLVHATDLDDARPLPDAKRAAVEFLESGRDLLRWFSDRDNRIYPHVIRIEEVRTDRWGRRVVRAVSDADRVEEIFTEEHLVPGQLYLMRPLRGSLRVDPVLAPLGAIWDT